MPKNIYFLANKVIKHIFKHSFNNIMSFYHNHFINAVQLRSEEIKSDEEQMYHGANSVHGSHNCSM